MNIAEMHYDFKQKMNKVDSQSYRNFLVPEIDWLLNQAIGFFVKTIAEPRTNPSLLGFEVNQRSIDDIRPLVVNSLTIPVNSVTSTTTIRNVVSLPNNYQHYLRARVFMRKNNCENVNGILKIRQHDDEFQESSFDSSSFEWGILNGVFTQDGIKLYPTDFKVIEIYLSYIMQHPYIHNAENFKEKTYTLLDNTKLIGSVDCILPNHTHAEIVDIAVLMASRNIQTPDYQIKMANVASNLK